MKKEDQLFNFLKLPLDILMVLIAFIVAYWIRANAIPFDVIYIWPFDQYIVFSLKMLPIWIIAFSIAGAYSNKKPAFLEFPQIIAASSLGSMAVVLWVFLFRSDFFSRLIVFYIWILAIVFVLIGRGILALIHTNSHLFRDHKKRILFIGNGHPTALHIFKEMKRRGNRYEIVGVLDDKSPKIDQINYLGKVEDLEKVIKNRKIDEVILTDTTFSNKEIFDILLTCQENSISFLAVPAHAQVGTKTLQLDTFAGIPVLEFKNTPLEGWSVVLKRILDLIGSTIAIIVLSPTILVISIIIKATSKGPVIYKNERVGNKGKFITYKFRTMKIEHCTGSEYGGKNAQSYENKLISKQNIKQGSAVYKIADDPRITKIGHFLRKTSLDELPQFYNVLLGNMSIVGPRPHQPREVKNYKREQRRTLLVRPGITGLAQISGRSDLSFDEESRLDIYYIENWSLWLDIYIILKTFGAVFKGKGSY